MKGYVSELERIYYEKVLPRLDDKIKAMNLGRRANSSIVNSGIHTIDELANAIKDDKTISMLSRESKEEIIENLKKMGKL